MSVQGASISVPSVVMMDAGVEKDAEIDAAGEDEFRERCS
jgi:hypothetical protein